MAETLSIISVVSFVAAGVFTVQAVVIWFLFKIPTVAGDLSGRNARRAIERMRKINEKTGAKSFAAGSINIKRNVMTGIRKDSGTDENAETGLLNENKASGYKGTATGLLVEENAASRLEGAGETAPLKAEESKPGRKAPGIKITLLEEIMYVHTEEVI